jgi:hypothetical protein
MDPIHLHSAVHRHMLYFILHLRNVIYFICCRMKLSLLKVNLFPKKWLELNKSMIQGNYLLQFFLKMGAF